MWSLVSKNRKEQMGSQHTLEAARGSYHVGNSGAFHAAGLMAPFDDGRLSLAASGSFWHLQKSVFLSSSCPHTSAGSVPGSLTGAFSFLVWSPLPANPGELSPRKAYPGARSVWSCYQGGRPIYHSHESPYPKTGLGKGFVLALLASRSWYSADPQMSVWRKIIKIITNIYSGHTILPGFC